MGGVVYGVGDFCKQRLRAEPELRRSIIELISQQTCISEYTVQNSRAKGKADQMVARSGDMVMRWATRYLLNADPVGTGAAES